MSNLISENAITYPLPVFFRIEHNPESGALYLFYGVKDSGQEQGLPITVNQLRALLGDAESIPQQGAA
jgi:hypothetical protein